MQTRSTFTAGARAVLCEGFLWGPPRSWAPAVARLSIVLAIAVGLTPHSFRVDYPMLDDGHARMSLSLAIAQAHCGRPFTVSPPFDVPGAIIADDSLRAVPIPVIIDRLSGSLEAYCGADQPWSNNENSLMLVEAAIMRVLPASSLNQLGNILHWIRIAVVLAFVLLMLALGGSVALAVATLVSALNVLDGIYFYPYSNYPFLFVLVMGNAALYGLAWHRQWSASARGLGALAVAAGLLAAFIVNMRTSYLPIVAVQFGVCVAAECGWRSSGWPASRLARALLLVAGFTGAFALFQYAFISRHISADDRQARHHSVAHPLVLALATPPNSLSRELGITWLDSVGGEKARSAEPGVEYLGPRYDAALFRYYRSLWRNRPAEMLAVYRLKFGSVGPDMIDHLRHQPSPWGSAINRLLTPISWLPNGLWLLGFYGAIACGALLLVSRSGGAAPLVALHLSTAAVLLQAEAGMIYSLWVAQYHSYLAFFALFVSWAGAQAMVNGAVALVFRWWAIPTVQRIATGTVQRLGWEVGAFLGLLPEGAGAAGQPRRVRAARTAIHGALVAVLAAMMVPAAWGPIERTPTSDRQAAAAVDGALRLALCGPEVPAVAPALAVAEEAISDPDRQLLPFRAMVMQRAGSLTAYCASVGQQPARVSPVVALEAVILSLRPNLSAAGLGKSLHYLRVLGVVTIGIVMMYLGFSPIVTLVATGANLWLLVMLSHRLYSATTFAPVLMTLTVMFYAWAATAKPWHSNHAALVLGLVAGAWSSLIGSAVPALSALAVVPFAALLVTVRPVRHRLASCQFPRMVMAAAYLAVGVVTLGAGLIGGAADSATDLAIGPAFGFPTTMSFLVLFGFGTAAMALRVRTSPELPAVMGVLVGACGCFCAARLLASGSDPLTDTALLILFSGLMIVLGGQLSARALLRR